MTQELVDDAADRMAEGMNEIGQRAQRVNNPLLHGLSATPRQSSLAAAASLNWNMRESSVANQLSEPQAQTKNNPFIAFEDDSDSENEWASKKDVKAQQFQFQPASFSFQPTISHAPQDEYVDPDL
jgi:hypothetical protein